MSVTERAMMIVARIADANPIGYDDWENECCTWCDAVQRGNEWDHDPDCTWMEACDLVDAPHDRHLITTYGPNLTPPLNGQIMDLTFTYGTNLPESAFARTVRKISLNGKDRWGFPWRTPDDNHLRLATYDTLDTARAALALTPGP